LLDRVAPQRRLSLSADTQELLKRYPFPGKVRELRNVLERAALLADGHSIEPAHVERALDAGVALSLVDLPSTKPAPAGASALGSSLRSVERATLQAQLKAHQGSRAELAQKLGISERSLYRKLREIGDDPDAA
jgi:DNA-binding NtrC family response regulator